MIFIKKKHFPSILRGNCWERFSKNFLKSGKCQMESVKNFLKDSPENSRIILAQISKKKVPDFFYSRGNTYWNFSFPKISKNLNWLPSSIIQTGKLFWHILWKRFRMRNRTCFLMMPSALCVNIPFRFFFSQTT